MRWILLSALWATGCGLTLDLDPPDPPPDASGLDAGVRDAAPETDAGECAARPDGSRCAGGFCVDGACAPSVCGDGIVDPDAGEQCEGGEACEACRFVCDCPDLVAPCLVELTCESDRCAPVWAPDGAVCGEEAGIDGECRGGRCIPDGCGDGVIEGVEECDDGNDRPADGCEIDCTFTCHEDADCDDGDVCDGEERCVTLSDPEVGVIARQCTDGAPLELGPCEACDPDRGPYVPDADGDGFAGPDAPSGCRTLDCDDANPAVSPGATEVCDGLDNDCDGSVDDGSDPVICAPDRDGDGWAGTEAGTTAPGCADCPPGTAPVRSVGADCWDVPDSFGPRVNPAQTGFFPFPFCDAADPRCSQGFDWNCDGTVERQLEREVDCDSLRIRGCRGDGWQGGVPDCGDAAPFVTCEPRVLFCGSSRDTATQSCR
ncbi:MAG: MopE-related protein [Myxococcota bacterium]|nr:MopE-related protein [Myxococcota bacterium]